ncbi:MGMT family protein [Bacteroides sp. 214]|uniref:MGMT family protein n=1 Tax=Bacteroides sp. 214 TaxID=2302935 RepID=UPI0013D10A85|nr:MGMT family protein [Bacteroides sp. 214]NDW13500.1 MGMT family protein [Bacteroides sp. 214]
MKIDKETFFREVYEVLTVIPSGSVISYGEIAELLGKPAYSRMVGRALRIVPEGLSLPCHRVVNAQGRLAPGWEEQRQLLLNEGVIFRRNGTVDMDKSRWRWKEI